MADEELIKILKQGPHVWNEWRSKQLDLSGVIRPPDTDLTGIDLHGANLKGDGNVPALAGRSPSTIVRQLYDIQHGTRGGPVVDPMKPEVANMTNENRVDIAAYLASLNP